MDPTTIWRSRGAFRWTGEREALRLLRPLRITHALQPAVCD